MNSSYSIISYDNLPNVNGVLVLVHAMYTNGNYFEKPTGKSLVDYFIKEGFIVKRLDLSGYTESEKENRPDPNINFETYVNDIELAGLTP